MNGSVKIKGFFILLFFKTVNIKKGLQLSVFHILFSIYVHYILIYVATCVMRVALAACIMKVGCYECFQNFSLLTINNNINSKFQ